MASLISPIPFHVPGCFAIVGNGADSSSAFTTRESGMKFPRTIRFLLMLQSLCLVFATFGTEKWWALLLEIAAWLIALVIFTTPNITNV